MKKLAIVVAMVWGVLALGQEPVALVNGEPVTREELDRATRLSEILFTLYQDFPEFTQALLFTEEGQALLSRYERDTLERIILRKLQLQEARKRGLSPSEEAVNARVEQTLMQIMLYYGLTEESLAQILESQGTTVEGFRAEIARQVEEQLLLEELKNAVVGEVEVEEEEIVRYYEENAERFKNEDGELRPLEEVRADIVALLLPTKREAFWQQWLADLRAKADVVISL